MYRRLFAEDPSSFQLKNPHLMLHEVFALPNDKWEFQQESSEEVCYPLYIKWAQKLNLMIGVDSSPQAFYTIQRAEGAGQGYHSVAAAIPGQLAAIYWRFLFFTDNNKNKQLCSHLHAD